MIVRKDNRIMPELPIPPHFHRARAGQVWRVPYQQRAAEALAWARTHGLQPASEDERKIGLLIIDYQNTFCLPDFELFVAGRSGTGAVDDAVRLCEFIYRNMDVITTICPTLDTHIATQIFHPMFLVDDRGHHPPPMTQVSVDDVERGRWRVNPAVVGHMRGCDHDFLQAYLLHYCRKLRDRGKYALMIWPYHAMLGGIGHALVSAVEEALFFYTAARQSQIELEIKGGNPLTENYSAVQPEVLQDQHGQSIAAANARFTDRLLSFDALIVAGQAKSHCVAWTIEDLLEPIQQRDPSLAQKLYLLEDCMSPVCIPGVVDFTDRANAAFERFAEAGMNIVRSVEPIATWPGMHRAGRSVAEKDARGTS